MKGNRRTWPASNFRGPAEYPNIYPGLRPASDYLLGHDGQKVPRVYLLHETNLRNLGNCFITYEGKEKKLDDYLHSQGRYPIENRIPSLAYGSNVNPMQLVTRKFGVLKKGFELPDIDTVVLKGSTPDYSAVYTASVAAYGSVPAKIIPSAGTMETWLLLLDEEQLRRMHDTEGVKTGTYGVGLQAFEKECLALDAYGYLGGRRKVFVNAEGKPVRFAGPEYSGTYMAVKAGKDFVPIAGGDGSFPEMAEIEIMTRYDEMTRSTLGYPLYAKASVNGRDAWLLTQDAKGNLTDVNRYLDTMGMIIEPGTGLMANPYELGDFKRLKDLL